MTDNTQTGSDNDVTRKDSLTEVEADSIKGVQAELDDILNRHGAEAGEMTHSLKQAITNWHNKRELEARIDTLEYAKISPKFKIEEKIEQLRLELKKYE